MTRVKKNYIRKELFPISYYYMNLIFGRIINLDVFFFSLIYRKKTNISDEISIYLKYNTVLLLSKNERLLSNLIHTSMNLSKSVISKKCGQIE